MNSDGVAAIIYDLWQRQSRVADNDGGTNKELNASGDARERRDSHAACHAPTSLVTCMHVLVVLTCCFSNIR